MTLHRLIPVLAGVALLGVLAAPAAGSSDPSVDRALAQVDRSGALVARSVDAAEAGNTARGYELARTAYLDHFEVVEIPLRLRDPNLVLDLEFQFAQLPEVWVGIGGLLAAIALVGVGYAIFKLGRRLPVRPLLIAAAAVLMLLSVAFVGNAVRSLQEADVVSIAPIHDGWATLPIFLAELTGIHPTTQSVGAQAVLLLIYVLGALYMF